jgi:hypothetical protein
LTETPLDPNWFVGKQIVVKHIAMKDHEPPPPGALKDAAIFVDDEIKNGKKVLVHCVPPRTMIGAFLPAPIESVDEVIGSDGVSHPVTKRYSHQFSGLLLQISARGTLPLLCTPEHPLLVFRPYKEPGGYFYKPNWNVDQYVAEWNRKQPVWLPARDVKIGDFLLSTKWRLQSGPLQLRFSWKSEHPNAKPVRENVASSELAWFFGFYIADGSSVGEYGIQLTLAKDDDLDRVIDAVKKFGLEATIREKDTYTRVLVNSRTLSYNFRLWFGRFSQGKKIPAFLYRGWDMKSLVDGLLQGDGSFYKPRKTNLFYTTSLTLAYQVWYLLVSLGEYPFLYEARRYSGYNNASPGWSLEWRSSTHYYTSHWLDYYCLPVVSIERVPYHGPVHNIEVGEVHDYMANGILSHNCLAGKGRTGTVIAAYLIMTTHMSAKKAVESMRRRRPGSVESGQEDALLRYDNKLQKPRSS